MRAAVFVRYHSGDGFGHVGWAFEIAPGCVDAGSVENHSGHLFTPATDMGFWNGSFTNPVSKMRDHRYDDLKWIDVEPCDPRLAHRTVLWIRYQAYRVWHRNCEDDVYDVLRAYGVQDLALPSLFWFPKTWFARFRGELAHVAEYEWGGSRDGSTSHDDTYDDVPWWPTWRRPWHPHFHALKLQRLQLAWHKR
ncbi:MAG TPA: hypothetical protein VJP85_05940 [Candidatus Baltobacteraceae bacterium]|nr:hypothetical protein [Candidatus Baltobacteraceae bacterium]